jgi:hypothetical protein
MPQTPIVTTGPVYSKADQAIVDKLQRATWENRGEVSSLPGEGPIYKAYFGKDIKEVVAFLDRKAAEDEPRPYTNKRFSAHGYANFESKDGFVIISRCELDRLGVTPPEESRRR